ncbi:MAG: hypothetical protein ACFWT5_14870 [Pseudomonas helleri]|jgi:hypothetical protein|uniref:phage protein GemA/Gp16 family protein n=1 Tax=Pseudomonas helleri TaxID=1608996 RepID=UPI003A101D62
MSQMSLRQSLSAMAHILSEKIGLEGESYRTYLMCITGKTSCSDCDVETLQRFVDALMMQLNGIDPDQPKRAVERSFKRRPTNAIPTLRQWETLLGLAVRMGWTGLEDAKLLAFVQRTAHVEIVHDLTKSQISACITGLMNWQAQIKAKESGRG